MVGFAWPRLVEIREETSTLADEHSKHQTSHPGWSFPARIWSDAASLDLPPERLMEQARLRGYEHSCPVSQPGEYCIKTGNVIPRGGHFLEGDQPPGVSDWSRPPALEPILIGTLVGIDGEMRVHLPLEVAPDHLIAAITNAEDANFQKHPGVNPAAGLRAAWANIRHGSYTQGASTLTMQMVRVLTQRREKTLPRKLREMAMAVSLDGKLGKDGVMQMYLDAPYLGQQGGLSICGFQAAAQHYWGIDATELSIAQAALLAGILPAPGRYGPDVAPTAARARRNRVLRRMNEAGWDVTDATNEGIDLNITPKPPNEYPAYLQATRAWLEDHLPSEVVYGAGLDVFTAMDVVAQSQTEEELPKRLKWLEKVVGRRGNAPLQAAAALLEPTTGSLVAAYGGTIEAATDFNRATQARRQAGSAFKPLVYALAFSRTDGSGKPLYSAADTVPNRPRTFEGTEGWRPRNISGEYTPTSSLAMGLAWSQNVATASLLEELGGPRYLVDFAGRLGFDTRWLPEEMGLALGQGEVTPVEMARFAATIINGGNRASGSPVLAAVDAAGQLRIGAVPINRPVMTPEAAALTRELMKLVVTYGTGGASRGVAGIRGYNGPAIGKTGTTDKEYDLWFNGGTPYYAASIWVGYDKPTRIGGSSSEIAAPLWGWWMRAVHEGLPPREFEESDFERRTICTVSGLRKTSRCRGIPAPFLPGTEPTRFCPMVHPKPKPKKNPEYQSLWKRRAAARAKKAETKQNAQAPSRKLGPSPL